jgi:abortive infection bacteriophage resistance protein
MSYKSTNALMRHLRDCGIEIYGSRQKTQLINSGYYHGYKGYRFFKTSSRRLHFTKYSDVDATIQYDSKLKSLIYEYMMFIETAVKNVALNRIMSFINSENIQDMYRIAISSYTNCNGASTKDLKHKFQRNKLKLQSDIQSNINRAYNRNDPKISHFYNLGYQSVPLWALFEILTMGDFGFLLSCLTFEMRDDISKSLGLDLRFDTNRENIYRYIYTLKDLRNAVAHNAVVFDTRFSHTKPSPAMKKTLQGATGLPYINFKNIGDYIILMCYYLQLLDCTKTEIKSFIRRFERITEDYRASVDPNIAKEVIQKDLSTRMEILKSHI